MNGQRIKCAIIGPGNIGMDLMYKILKRANHLQLALMVGNSESKHLPIAAAAGVRVTDQGIEELLKHNEIRIVFDATLASAHMVHAPKLEAAGMVAIDLTPAAVGRYVCPPVNLGEHMDATNINLITCGGQATIPIVAAINAVCPVDYAEIVATIASDSAGMGTRESIDEFTITTAKAIRDVGGALRSKAIILLNPAKPPIMMNNTIYCLLDEVDEEKVTRSIDMMVEIVKKYVPGYRLKIPPQYDGKKVTVMVEVEGAGDYLPAYSGNLDIETSSALEVGEQIAQKMLAEGGR